MPRRRSTSASTSGTRSPKRTRFSERLLATRTHRDELLGLDDHSGRMILVSDADYLANAKALKEFEDESGSELRPRSVGMLPKENSHSHRTDEYECPELVLRRGQEFDLSIHFDRKYNPEMDSVILQLVVGARPKASKGTVIRIEVSESIDKVREEWQAKVDSIDEEKLNVIVWSPTHAIVGKYRLFVVTQCEDETNSWTSRREMPDPFILIFNPWCKGDLVYIEDDECRKEYVMNETGRIWQGSARSHHGQPWNFGQFEGVCIESALYLLDKAELSDGARSNPVHIIRSISQMSNSNDADGGVLTGRWTDTYPKSSTVPWAWSGSVAILEEFMKTKKAVCYGQCWVFSGLVTTLLRALGIGTRSVTNFESAHDNDGSATIDYHWNEADEPLTDDNDSVWNFHVWNESWFKRPDLPEGYDGWQAHDATPQEASEGVMKCGPAPVKAIKEGNVYLPYDAKFIFAEVNGDKVHWLVKEDGSMSVLCVESHSVGAKISTKSVGSNFREDLTQEYKFPEGSPEERKSVHRAFRFSSRRDLRVYDVDAPDVSFNLDCPDDVTLGDDFEIKVHLKNEEDEERNVHVRLSAVAAFYTGVPSENVGVQEFEEKLAGKEEKTISLAVPHTAYEAILKPESIVKVYLKGTVKESSCSYAHIDAINIKKPDLAIIHPDKVKINEDFEIHIKFKNPLEEKLTNGCFHIEGHGITKALVVPYKKAIAPGEDISHTVALAAYRSGSRELVVNFSSDQLTGMSGSAEIYISYSF